VANACNPSYSGGRDQEDQGSKPAQANPEKRKKELQASLGYIVRSYLKKQTKPLLKTIFCLHGVKFT
jgi:hypothetical protein